MGAGAPLPKPLKLKVTDADTALPILRAKRSEILERVGDAEGKLRRACVQDVAHRRETAEDTLLLRRR